MECLEWDGMRECEKGKKSHRDEEGRRKAKSNQRHNGLNKRKIVFVKRKGIRARNAARNGMRGQE